MVAHEWTVRGYSQGAWGLFLKNTFIIRGVQTGDNQFEGFNKKGIQLRELRESGDSSALLCGKMSSPDFCE